MSVWHDIRISQVSADTWDWEVERITPDGADEITQLIASGTGQPTARAAFERAMEELEAAP